MNTQILTILTIEYFECNLLPGASRVHFIVMKLPIE
jgi:hypothetical protein